MSFVSLEVYLEAKWTSLLWFELKQRSGLKREKLLGDLGLQLHSDHFQRKVDELALFLQNYWVQSLHWMWVWGVCVCVCILYQTMSESAPSDRTGAGVKSSCKERGYARQKMLSSLKKGKSVYLPTRKEEEMFLRVKNSLRQLGKTKNVHHLQLPW